MVLLLTSLTDELGSAAFREFGRIYGVRDELERLKNTVESIKAVLLDAEEKQEAQNHAVQNWVRRLNDVLLPADDLIDEFFLQDMIHKRDKAHKNKVTKMLTFMPTFPNIQKRLELRKCNAEILEATLNIAESQHSTPLSMLKSLNINDTIMGMEKAPKDWFKNLTSLEKLGFSFLSSQEYQVIEMWFNDNLNRLPLIQKIAFNYCFDLKALPDWICNISSLQQLTVFCCQNLAAVLPTYKP